VNSETEYEAPRNEIEEKLVEIWKDVLGVEDLGINDHFFELGGHSLKATQLVSKFYRSFKVEIKISDIFQYPTIKKMASYIETRDKFEFLPIPKAILREHYPVSSIQKGIYVLQILNPYSTSYNMPIGLSLKGTLNYQKIEDAFNKIIQRHEIFKTSFSLVDGQPVQLINKIKYFKVDMIELKDKKQIKDYIVPFNLNTYPLFRVGLFRESEKEHIMVADLHHIIGDGISAEILIKEFIQLYKGEELEPLEVTYKDYVCWKEERLLSNQLNKEEEYWTRKLSGSNTSLNFPLDFERPPIMSFNGKKLEYFLNENLTTKLNAIALENDCTIYMVLLTVYNLLLSSYSGQDEITVGTSVGGRKHPSTQGIIGPFINMLPMKNTVAKEKTVKELLMQIKENTLEAFEHQEFPYEKMVENISIRRDVSRNAIFDTIFDVQNMERNLVDLGELKINEYYIGDNGSKADIVFYIEEVSDKLKVNIEFNTTLFKEETMDKFGNNYKELLSELLENTDRVINKLEYFQKIESRLNKLSKFKNTDNSDLFNFD
ncbi:condensation domain-containing protein, partial [Lysinibacillus xylanilyticus]|uniref:condensation domain-containing protein n=1 Tax=Lysinibacillus xylanilyticus TaxID=582475 RepID=UPI0038290F85